MDENTLVIPEHNHPTFMILGMDLDCIAIFTKLSERLYWGGKNCPLPLDFPILAYHYTAPLVNILQSIGELVTYGPDKRRLPYNYMVEGNGERVTIERHMNAYRLAKALSCNPEEVMDFYKRMVVTVDE